MHIATLEMLEQAKFAPEQARLLLEIWEKQETRHREEHAALAERLVPREELKARQEILATKEDLHKLKDELKQDILATKEDIHKLDLKMEQNSLKLVQWVMVMLVAQTGLLAGLLKLFLHN